MATIEIPDTWLESTGLSLEEAKDYLLVGYPIMREICLSHMTSTTIRTPLTSVIGYASAMLKGVDGAVTETQGKDLQTIVHSAKFLFEHLTEFLYLVSSVFKDHSIHLGSFDVKETVTAMVSHAARDCEYEIEYNIPYETLTIRSDQYLIDKLLYGMVRLLTRICPTCKGTILVSAEQVESMIRIVLSMVSDVEHPFYVAHNDPFVFMVHSLTRHLKGSFEIVQEDDSWQLTALLPIIYE